MVLVLVLDFFENSNIGVGIGIGVFDITNNGFGIGIGNYWHCFFALCCFDLDVTTHACPKSSKKYLWLLVNLQPKRYGLAHFSIGCCSKKIGKSKHFLVTLRAPKWQRALLFFLNSHGCFDSVTSQASLSEFLVTLRAPKCQKALLFFLNSWML